MNFNCGSKTKIYLRLFSFNSLMFVIQTWIEIIGISVFEFLLSNGHSPQIRQNGELLVRMCRGESHFSQKALWRM